MANKGPQSFYDVIVSGNDLAGLIAAALCARRGLRVLLLEGSTPPVESFEFQGVTLPRSPLPFGLGQSPAFRRVVSELNFVQTLKRRTQTLRPSFQIVLPDARLDVGPDGDLLTREIAREFAADREVLESFVAQAGFVSQVLEPVLGQDVSLPPEGFWEKREIRYTEGQLPTTDLLPGLPAGHAARAFASLPAALTLDIWPSDVPPAVTARAFDRMRHQAARLEGGHDLLRQLLIEKLKTHHAGEVKSLLATQIATRFRKVQGVIVAGREDLLGARHVLWAQPVTHLHEQLADKPPKRLQQTQDALKPAGYRVAFHVLLSAAGIPEGLGSMAFACFDPGAALWGDNALALYVSDPDDNARVTLTVTANVPAQTETNGTHTAAIRESTAATVAAPVGASVLAALRESVFGRLADLLPFYEAHRLGWISPHEGASSNGSVPVLAPDPLWPCTAGAALQVSGAGYDMGIKNLIHASSQSLPGLGLEGQFAAGWCAARLLTAEMKNKDYLKDEVLSGSS